MEVLKDILTFRSIQITYITHNAERLRNIIQFYQKTEYDVDSIVELILQSEVTHFKINYILIKGLNDSEADFTTFISTFKSVKDKVTIRISKINDTGASRKNEITGASIERMSEFRKRLLAEGYRAYLFYSYEDDNMNCGQLITEDRVLL